MNVTFLIGNGFDLACGLKSSYPNVYEEYIKQPSQSEVVKKFKDDLIANKTKENWGNWSDFEMGMAEYAKKFNNEKELIECVSDFKAFLEDHLEQEERSFYFKFRNISKEDKQTITENIISSFHDFYKGVSNNITNYFRPRLLQGANINFINFNYTRVFDFIIKNFYDKNANICHIHGDLMNHDVVLGVNHEDQILKNFDLTNRGKRIFIKPFFNFEYDKEKLDRVERYIIDSDCVCLFGLSLGDSDYIWKELIIKQLSIDKMTHVFLFDYECEKLNIIDVGSRLNEEEYRKETNKLAIELCGKENKNFSKIHVPIGKKLFDIEKLFDVLQHNDLKKTNVQNIKDIPNKNIG